MTKRLRSTLILLAIGLTVGVSLALVSAQRSRTVGSAARVITLRAGDNLQAAINSAKFGDTIVLPAGASFQGPFTLPFKSGGSGTDRDYITIQTSAVNSIPPNHQRIKPAQHARAMARILAPSERAALTTEPGAHHYRFIGIEFRPADNSNYVYNVIELGSADQRSLQQVPHHLVFDRCYVRSIGLNRARRGFALNSGEAWVINSHISGFAGAGDETQAIAAWNGPGPFHIVNNYLEGAGEVVLVGGADPSIQNLVPADIEFRRNYLRKPKEWKGKALVKGTFELKNARRVLVEGNLIESEILTTAFVITVRNQSGKAPWSTIEDVEIKNNLIRYADSGVNLLGSDNEHRSQTAKRIQISNNLFTDIVVNDPSNNPYFLQINGGQLVTVRNNTVNQAGNIFTSYGSPTYGFIFRDNVVNFNRYGMVCLTGNSGCSPTSPFCLCFPAAVITGNTIVDNLGAAATDLASQRYPRGNKFIPKSHRGTFADFRDGQWRLTDFSQGNGNNVQTTGVDMQALKMAGAFAAREGDKFESQ